MAPNMTTAVALPSSSIDNNVSTDDGTVILGPDLNVTKSHMDKKLYRYVTLSNGLQCVLICDTVAMRQRKLEGRYYYDHDDESESGSSDDGSSDGSSSNADDSEDDDDGLRKAATALLVNVGSYHDPPHLQGLSHFLEHMLFLGTKDYPGDNEYDAFLSQHGGDDNAYTDMEHTLYHYCIPQDGGDGEKSVWKALKMFSSFFTVPLLGGEQAERELNAVESEFELNRCDDDCRLSQLMSETCGMDGNAPIMGREFVVSSSSSSTQQSKPFHPFAKFPWGNMASLKEEPERDGVDVMKELREHYNTHYFAKNMRLVVMAGYELDELQKRVVQYFSDVPSDPRVSHSKSSNNASGTTNLDEYKLPFHPSSLAKIYRIIPVHHRHSLTLTWQIPSMCSHWRTKPHDYLAHLLGHEASGSILSALKERGLAMGCSAGVGDDGLGDASTHALFRFQVTLSRLGVKQWEEVVEVVFAYIGMLRYRFEEGYVDENNNKVEGLAPWIYEELKSIAGLSYRFADEGDVTDIVEEIAENMAPWYSLPKEHVLDGDDLLFGDVVDNSTVKDLLFNYFKPEQTRFDLMSSLFGVDANFGDDAAGARDRDDDEDVGDIIDNNDIMAPAEDQIDTDLQDDVDNPVFDKAKAGLHSTEARFGTKYWSESISSVILQQCLCYCWKEEELVSCSRRAMQSGDEKSTEIQRLLLSYEDEEKKWHSLDSPKDRSLTDDELLEPGYEGTLDGGKIKFRLIAVAREGEGIVMRYGDADHDDDIEDGAVFPPIPPPSPASRLPRLVHDKHSLKLWHLQDRKFKRPVVDLRLRIECDGMNDSALNQGCVDLFCRLCADALVETCYLASTSELGSSISPTESGFSLRIHGFDHKLLDLTKVVLDVVMSFRGRDGKGDLPATINDGRFDACLESLLRRYRNAGMEVSGFCTSLRILCLRSTMKSAFVKLKAMEGIDVATFTKVMNTLLKKISIDALYHGNVDRIDADIAAKLIHDAMTRNCTHVGIPKKNLPTKLVTMVKLSVEHHQIISPSIDPKDPNTAVEVYFQVSKDNVLNRVLVDLIAHILEEPLYCQIRTKEQFGYQVSCGARWTFGVIGLSFQVVTACKSAEEASNRIDTFLQQFRSELASMDNTTYLEHLAGLAKNKLEMFDSLEDECSSHWSEIVERRYDWEAHRAEVLTLRCISREKLLHAYDEWFNPVCSTGQPNKRRKMVIHVIGTGEGDASIGRPTVDHSKPVTDAVEDLVKAFHKSVKNETWGRIAFGVAELHRAKTV
eukprot:g2198.t1 g2198   contig11:912012-915958(+)